MSDSSGKPEYDLESRTEKFAKDIRQFVKVLPKSILLPKSISNAEDVKQLVRASGSIAANYIEANEGFSKKDFIYRVKICRKESKESGLFIRLLSTDESETMENERERLNDESKQIMKIFGAIITKSGG